MENKSQILISDKDTTEMNESSSWTKYVEHLGDPNEYVFGLPDVLANKILEYVEAKDMFYVLRSRKSWSQRIKEYDSFKTLKNEFQFLKNEFQFLKVEAKDMFYVLRSRKSWSQRIKEYDSFKTLKNEFQFLKNEFQFLKNEICGAYIIWYIYGNGNAKRLSDIIDEVIEQKYKKVYAYQNMAYVQSCLSKFVEKKKDDLLQCVKKQKDDKSSTKYPLHYKIRSSLGGIGLKSHLWHLLLLAIVNIKKSDLKFDLHSDKKVDPIGYCHDLIYNYLVGDECKNLVLGLLGFDGGHVTHMFPDFMRLLHMRRTSDRIAFAILMCFLKVAFYKNQCVVKKFLSKKDLSIRTKTYLRNWQVAPFMFRERYYFWPTEEKHEYCTMIEPIAQYLYLTEELEDWLKRYKGDFIVFFGNTHINKFLQPVENSLNKRQVDFSAFLPYLNKIKSFDDRYRADKKGFWKMFFPNDLAGIPISDFTHCEELCLNITPYLNRDFCKEIWDYINLRSDIFHNLNYFKCRSENSLCAIKDLKCDLNLIANFMFDPSRQIKIDEEQLSLYFKWAIIYFFEMESNVKEWNKEGYKKLSNEDKNFIKSVSKIIINKREEHFEVPDELNQGFMFNDDKNDNDEEAGEKILSDNEIKISIDVSEEDKNLNKINFINEIKNSKKDNISANDKTKMSFDMSEEDKNLNKINFDNKKPDNKNDKNSEISTNNGIKTPMNNMNRPNILDKINNNLDGKAEPKKEEQTQKSKLNCQIF